MPGVYYTGCAVWAFKGWLGEFYPNGSKAADFLRLYGDRMTAVEGNTTFYSLPNADTIQRWTDTMPTSFRFCPKLPRAYSHQGRLMPFVADSLRFLKTLEPLGERLGPLFIQLPPGYSPALMADLQEFLAAWPRQRCPVAVEVRHLDWFQDPQATRLNHMLEAMGVSRVLLDTRPIYDCINTPDDDPQIGSERKKPKVPLQPVVTAPFTIVRYISHPKMEVNQPYFKEWVPRLKQWLQAGIDIYFFAHCPQEEKSPAIAREVYHQLQQAGADLPKMPWDVVVQQEETMAASQLSLF